MTVREPFPAAPHRVWRAGSREILLDHPMVVGILNVTPDSFSDGGNFFAIDAALLHAEQMIHDGADILDIGGESTRPGAVPVEAADEATRVLPVVRAIRERWPSLPISIDTVKSDVAAAALDAGADIINDVSAMRLDPAMPVVAARARCGVILMHSRGEVANMATYEHARYGDVANDVLAELGSQLLLAEDAGVNRNAVAFDPGFGFSKRSEHSRALLLDLQRFATYDVPVMVGVSRKRFVAEAMNRSERRDDRKRRLEPLGSESLGLEDKDAGTAAVNVMALERGAMLFRVHNVRINRRALDAAWAILSAAH